MIAGPRLLTDHSPPPTVFLLLSVSSQLAVTMPLPETCDTLIIGAGVVGVSLAYELAGRGTEVVLVDRQQPGLEASWAGAGLLPPGSWYDGHPALEALAALSRSLNAQWCTRLRAATGIDSEYRVGGAIHLALDSDDLARLEAKFADWRARGIETKALDPEQLAEIEPNLRAGDIVGAFHDPGEGRIHNRRHVQALVAACRQLGVTIACPAEVTAVERRGDRVSQVHTTAGSVAADRLVLAAGAWSGGLGELLGLRLAVRPLRGQMLGFFVAGGMPLGCNVHCRDRYLVPREGGELLVGSTVDDVGFDKHTVPEQLLGLEQFARALVPDLDATPVADAWAGLRPATLDGLPYLGPLPDFSNAYACTGHFRSGLQMASGTAVAMADVLAGQTPPLDLEPFRVDR